MESSLWLRLVVGLLTFPLLFPQMASIEEIS